MSFLNSVVNADGHIADLATASRALQRALSPSSQTIIKYAKAKVDRKKRNIKHGADHYEVCAEDGRRAAGPASPPFLEVNRRSWNRPFTHIHSIISTPTSLIRLFGSRHAWTPLPHAGVLAPQVLTKSLCCGMLCLVCVAHEDFAGDGFLLPTLPQRTLRWLALVQAHVEQIWTTYFAVTCCITNMLLVLRDLRHLKNRCPQRHPHG